MIGRGERIRTSDPLTAESLANVSALYAVTDVIAERERPNQGKAMSTSSKTMH